MLRRLVSDNLVSKIQLGKNLNLNLIVIPNSYFRKFKQSVYSFKYLIPNHVRGKLVQLQFI